MIDQLTKRSPAMAPMRSADLNGTQRRILIGAVVVAIGGGALLNTTPTPQEIEAARWAQAVTYFENKFEQVQNSSASTTVYWDAVVDYYEQQWAARQK